MALNLGYRVSFLAGYYQHIANILVSQLRKLQEGNPDENAATMARALRQIEKLKAECVTYEEFCGDFREQIIKVGLGLWSSQVSLSLVQVPLNEFASLYSLTPKQPQAKMSLTIS